MRKIKATETAKSWLLLVLCLAVLLMVEGPPWYKAILKSFE